MNVQPRSSATRTAKPPLRELTRKLMMILILGIFAVTTLAQTPATCITTEVNGFWSDSTTWNCGRVPTSIDTAVVDVAGTFNYNLLSTEVAGLEVRQGILDLEFSSSGSLTVNSQATIEGSVVDSAFFGGGSLRMAGTSLLNGSGVIETFVGIEGDVSTSGALTINGNVSVASSGSLLISDTLTVGGRLTILSPAFVEFAPGAVLDLDGDLDGEHCPSSECPESEFAVLRLGSGTLRISGNYPAPDEFGGGPHLEAGTGTVIYDGPGDQLINNSAPYFNLVFEASDFADFAPEYAEFYDRRADELGECDPNVAPFCMTTGPIHIQNHLELRSGARVATNGAPFDGMGTAKFTMETGSQLFLTNASSSGDGADQAAVAPANFSTTEGDVVLHPDSEILFASDFNQEVPPLAGGYGTIVICSLENARCIPPSGFSRVTGDPGEETASLGGTVGENSRRRGVRPAASPISAQAALSRTAGGFILAHGDLEILNDGVNTLTLFMGTQDLTVEGNISGNGGLSFDGTSNTMILGESLLLTGTFSPPLVTTFTGATGGGTLNKDFFIDDPEPRTVEFTGGEYSIAPPASGLFVPGGTVRVVGAETVLDLGASGLMTATVQVNGTIVNGTVHASALNGAGQLLGTFRPPMSGAATIGGMPTVTDLGYSSGGSITNNASLLTVTGTISGDLFDSTTFIAGVNSGLLLTGVNPFQNFAPSDLEFSGATNVVHYAGGNQAIADTAYDNLHISGGGIKTASADLLLSGDLFIATGTTLAFTGGTQDSVGGNVTIGGIYDNGGARGLRLNGPAPQTVSSSGPLTFSDLTIQQDVTLSPGTDFVVDSVLSLNSGVLTIANTNPLFLRGSVSQAGGVVNGPIIKEFASPGSFTWPFGDGTVSMPVTVNVSTLTGSPATLLIEPVQSPHPSAPEGSLTGYWEITPSNIGLADVTFVYDQSQVPGGDDSNYLPARWNGTSWEVLPDSSIDTTTNTATVLNVDAFSPWTIGPFAVLCTVTTTADSGTGSLRQAIDDANAGTCTAIDFDIASTGPHTISISNPLLLTADNVVIDAFTQPGAAANTAAFGAAVNAVHQIRIQPMTPGANGLNIQGDGNAVRGIWFDGLQYGVNITGNGNVVAGSLFTDSSRGVAVAGGTGNLVGGTAAADRNVFDFLWDDGGGGIWSDGTSDGTEIRGNYIGVDATGTGGSGIDGFGIRVLGAADVIIDQNVVSRSGRVAGVGILIEANNTTISSNRIGTTADGSSPLPNGTTGISARLGIALWTGGGATIDSNLISAHDDGGSALVFASNGQTPLEAGIYVRTANNTITSNDISDNWYGIIFDTGAGANNVVGGGLGANNIQNNGLTGIVAVAGTGNKWVDNVIANNSSLAIDLGDDGADVNDAGDGDTGPNGKQNHPVITSANLSGGTLTATVSLDSSSPNPGSLLIEIVESDGSGQIVSSLGTQCLAGNVFVDAPVSVAAGTVTGGSLIAALATSYSDGACSTMFEGTSEVGGTFAVNTVPVAVDDAATTPFETPVTIDVLANDFDVDGDPLTISAFDATSTEGGSVTCTTPNCTYTPPAGFSGTDTFTYTVSDPDGATDTATVTITVLASPTTDLEIVKTGPASATPDEAIVFTITVTNLGPASAADVVVSDPTPDGLVFVSNSGACTSAFPCALGTIPAGEMRTITSTWVLADAPSSSITNTATVSTSTGDSNPANDTSSAVVALCPTAPTNPLVTPGTTSAQLSWNDSGADRYAIHLGAIGIGCSTLFAETTATNHLAENLEPGTEYEWRAVAIRDGCVRLASACLRFTTETGDCPTELPQLVTPAPNATVTSPVTFEWTAVTGAAGYELYVDQGAGAVLLTTTPLTSVEVSLPEGAMTWWVDAISPGCSAGRSDVRELTVFGASDECSEQAPLLIAPANGATALQSPVTFQWGGVTGATEYRVWVASEDSFPIVVGRTSATSLTASVPSGVLTWHIQALFDGCPPNISEQRTLSVTPREPCPTGLPTLMAPEAGSQTGSPVTFEWSAVPGAVRYAVWASIDGDSESIIGTVEGGSPTTLEREFEGESVEWFVEVFFDGCPSLKTQAESFFVITAKKCVTDAPVQVSPGNQAAGLAGLVKFEWETVETAVGYRLWVRTDGVGEFELLGSTLAETELELPIRGNMAEWYVQAVFIECPATRSPTRQLFLKQPTSCDNRPSQLLLPADRATERKNRVRLVWTAEDGVDAYVVWMARDDGKPSRVALTRGHETSVDVELNEGSYQWWVTSRYAGCNSLDSARSDFRVDLGIPDACLTKSKLLLVSPAEGAPDIASPVIFAWTKVPGATGYQIWVIEGKNAVARTLGEIRTGTQAVVKMSPGTIRWYVEAFRSGCPSLKSPIQHFRILMDEKISKCMIPDAPVIKAPQLIASGSSYKVVWNQVPGATVYEIQESTTGDFRGLPVWPVKGTSATFKHQGGLKSPQKFSYRVRALADCDGERGPYSRIAEVRVNSKSFFGSGNPLAAKGVATGIDESLRVLELNLDAFSQEEIEEFVVILTSRTGDPETVRIVADQDWISVIPDVVTLLPEGTEVTIRAEMNDLPLGSNSATLRFESLNGSGFGASATTSTSVSVAKVTPVSATPKNEPLPESLIIPAVAHASGFDSTWLSDIRLSNVGAVAQKYQINFTPSAVDGTQTGKTTNIDVQAGSTVALNDVLANWYGVVEEGASETGVLEIRPLKANSSASFGGLGSVSSGGATTVASSRTYNFTPSGTFGQFIPAVPFASFAGAATDDLPAPKLSMQQISQSASYRTNLGLVEASGKPVDVLVRVFTSSGSLVGSFTETLAAGEHRQLNSVLEQKGMSVENGRIEVTAVSGAGRVTAYASVVDRRTNDPQLVPAVRLDQSSGKKWILPGVADFNTGQASWRTDSRLFNAGETSAVVTLSYFPQNDPASKQETTLRLEPGEIAILDDLVASYFGKANSGGAVHVETSVESNIVATARTYDRRADGGTFGQFIPAVAATAAVGRGERALQILQVEESERFRANLGLAEVTGQAVNVEVSVSLPGSKASPRVTIPLQGNEFKQLVGVLKQMGISEAYNVRISVKAVGGDGKVVAYGSMVDNETQDPTYVPAQ
jgi:uncharacterized repeat protein (TIGR01451 family)